jgi:hypothetical protein
VFDLGIVAVSIDKISANYNTTEDKYKKYVGICFNNCLIDNAAHY